MERPELGELLTELAAYTTREPHRGDEREAAYLLADALAARLQGAEAGAEAFVDSAASKIKRGGSSMWALVDRVRAYCAAGSPRDAVTPACPKCSDAAPHRHGDEFYGPGLHGGLLPCADCGQSHGTDGCVAWVSGAGRIRQSNESAAGPELSCALYCEEHGMAEARKLHEEAQQPGAGLVSAWEPQAEGQHVARFDLLAPNPPGHIRFTRYSDSTEPCVVCAAQVRVGGAS